MEKILAEDSFGAAPRLPAIDQDLSLKLPPRPLIVEIADEVMLLCGPVERDQKYANRRARTSKRLQEVGLSDINVIVGEPGNEDIVRLKIDLYEDRPGYFVGAPGKRHQEGAAYKHLTALERIVEKNLERALIFEDDVLFHERFADIFPSFYSAVPDNADIVYLGFGNPIREFVESLSEVSPLIWKGAFWCNHALLVSNAGARKILSSLPVHDNIDFFYGRLAAAGSLNCYAFRYLHEELESTQRCAYTARGLVYQERD